MQKDLQPPPPPTSGIAGVNVGVNGLFVTAPAALDRGGVAAPPFSGSNVPKSPRRRFSGGEGGAAGEVDEDCWRAMNLASFLPDFLLKKFKEQKQASGDATWSKPTRENTYGVIAIFDLCGFTRMAEELKNEHTGNLFYTEERKAASGHRGSAMTHRQALSMGMDGAPAARSAKTYKIIKSQFSDVMARNGTEKLRYIIGDFFQQLMHLIVDGGGDIIRLAGDALIAVFSMHNLSKMAQVVHDAATVAMESVVFLDGNVFHGKKVHLRVGLDMGTINIMVLGSKEQGWQYVVAGEPFAQLDSLLEDGVSGDILVTKKFWEAIKRSKRKEWTAEQLSGSRGTNPHFKLNYTGKLVRTKHEYPDREALLEDSAQSMENLRVFVPGCVLHACEAEGSGWFSYIQRVTMLFIKAGVDKAKLMDAQGGDGLLAHLQAVYNLMQEVVLRYDGVIKEFTVDDKGLVLMAAMGVPPATGDNQPEKACLAALEVVEVLREGAGCPAYVGISTGMVFTASVGTGRRELAMVGDAVNKAARLMSMAFKRFGPEEESKILVADTAYEDAKFRIEFEYWDTIKVKNKEETISCYVPKAPMQGGYAVMLPGNVDMVQRHSMSGDNVAEVATRRVERLARGEGGGLLLIEGLPGLGKSFLLTGLMHQWEHTFAPDNIKFICDRAHQQDLLPVRGTGGGGSNFNSTLDGDIGELQRSLGSNGSIRGQGLRKGSLDKAQQQAEEHPLASWRPVLISLLLAFKNHVMSYAVACDRAFPPSRNSISSGGSSPSHQHRRNDSRFSSVGSTAVTLNAIEDTVAVPSGHVRFRDTSWIPPPTQEAPRSPGPNRHRGHRRSSSRSSALSSKRSMLSMYSGGDPDTCIMDSLDSISRHMSEMPVWAGAFGAYKEGGGSKDTRWSRGMFLHFFFDQFLPESEYTYWLLGDFLGADMPADIFPNKSFQAAKELPFDSFPLSLQDAIVDVLSITTASEKYPHMPVTFRVALLLETQQGLSTESLQLVRQVVTSPGLGERFLVIGTCPPLPLGAARRRSVDQLSATRPRVHKTRLSSSSGGSTEFDVTDSEENLLHNEADEGGELSLTGRAGAVPGSRRSSFASGTALEADLWVLVAEIGQKSATNPGVSLCRLQLAPLQFLDCRKLCTWALRADEVQDEVAVALFVRTLGMPLYISEYCKLLMQLEVGNVKLLVNGVSRAGDDSAGTRTWVLDEESGGLGGAIFQRMLGDVRLDGLVKMRSKVEGFLHRLSAQQLNILKILSCLGTSNIGLSVFTNIYPGFVAVSRDRSLEEELGILASCGVIVVESCPHGGDSCISFKDLVLHQVVYWEMPVKMRAAVHEVMARLLDHRTAICSATLDVSLKELVDHFPARPAVDLPQAAHHYESAGLKMEALKVGVSLGKSALEAWAEGQVRVFLVKAGAPSELLTCMLIRQLLVILPSVAGTVNIIGCLTGERGSLNLSKYKTTILYS